MSSIQNHLLIIDPLAALEFALDTSIRMGHALAKLGHQIYIAEPRHLAWASGKRCAHVHAQAIDFGKLATEIKAQPSATKSLDFFNAIHMRKDPPFDMDYIATTWLLESAEPKTKVYNKPAALRGINEKLSILQFQDAIAPALSSSQPSEILAFIKSTANGDAMLKPLTLYSGKGIHRINLNDGSMSEHSAEELIAKETLGGKSFRLVQPFSSAIYQGEVRAFYVGGEELAWCLKKPAEGQYMANSSFGSTRHKYRPTEIEKNRTDHVAKSLLKEGVAVVGFDLIGGFISEINLTSPRLLTAPEDDRDYFSEFADWLSSDSAD